MCFTQYVCVYVCVCVCVCVHINVNVSLNLISIFEKLLSKQYCYKIVKSSYTNVLFEVIYHEF